MGNDFNLSGDEFIKGLELIAASSEDNIAEMKKTARDAVFVLPDIALAGQCTIINARGGTGKTLLILWLLSQRNREATKHLSIHFINADDTYNGGIEKMEILRDFGFYTHIPGQKHFEPRHLDQIIDSSIKTKTCGRVVIILDTLKKFISTMNKNDAREFNNKVREFIGLGGTLIALAHTNKNKDADGKRVAEGVEDFHSDFDCGYIVDISNSLTSESKRTVIFENTKLRGPVAMKATFEYDNGEKCSWHRRFQSVRRVGEDEAKQASDAALKDQQREKDQPVIDYIVAQLEDGPKSHTNLAKDNPSAKTGSRGHREKVIERYVGQLWEKSKGQTGGWNYYIEQDPPSEGTSQKVPWN